MMKFLKQASLLAIIVSTLAGCGVKGDLQAPQFSTQN
jgi:predicted small lipoprotein YifL